MNWELLGRRVWHGISQAVITAGAALAVLQAWPSELQWLILGSGMAVAFVKGVEGFNANPEVSIERQDAAGTKP